MSNKGLMADEKGSVGVSGESIGLDCQFFTKNTDGMIRSERKINAVIHNAKCFQAIGEEYGSFSEYIWNGYLSTHG